MAETVACVNARRITLWKRPGMCLFDVEVDGFMIAERIRDVDLVTLACVIRVFEDGGGYILIPGIQTPFLGVEFRARYVQDFDAERRWMEFVQHDARCRDLQGDGWGADTSPGGGANGATSARVGGSATDPRGD